jgi:alkyl sulfatase BDS1-like metallo-beta-lactamase superfamily hydrolase
MYISGQEAIDAALTAQRDALQSIYDQTLARINAGDTIDEAAAAVALPADLAASPYNQEFVSTVPGIVRNVYQEKMGWFSGNITDLTSTLTETAKAQALSAAFAYPSLVEAAKQAELSAQDLPSAEKALYLAFMAYKSAPDDFTVKQIYAQALRKNAFMQKRPTSATTT